MFCRLGLSKAIFILVKTLFFFQALFKMEAQGIDLEFLTNSEYQKLQDAFAAQYISSDSDSILMARQAVAFIKEYTLEDIMVSYFVVFR